MLSVLFDEDLAVTFEVDDDKGLLLLRATLLSAAPTYYALQARALSLNMLSLHPLGSWLAYDADEGAVIMCYCDRSGQMSEGYFANLLHAFIKGARDARCALSAPANT